MPERSTENDPDCTVLEVGPAMESDLFSAVSEGCATSPGYLRAERLSGFETEVDEMVAASCAASSSAESLRRVLFLLGDSGVLVVLMKLVLDPLIDTVGPVVQRLGRSWRLVCVLGTSNPH